MRNETDRPAAPGRSAPAARPRRTGLMPAAALATVCAIAAYAPGQASAAPAPSEPPTPTAPAEPPAPPAPTTRAALTAAPQPAQDPTAPVTPAVPAAPGSPLEAGDADCPAIPAGADPARWRCEVHVGAPLLTVGAVEGLVLAPMTITFAGGPLPDGTKGQVFGALRSAAHRPGCPADCSGFRRRWARPPGPTPAARSAGSPSTQCGGRSDFCTGQLSLRLVLRGPLLPDSCAIGGSVPIDLALRRTAPAVRESEEPPLIRYSMEDGGFAAPVVGRCGPLGHLLDRRLGLPAADGNLLRLDAAYTFRTYDRLR